MRSSVHCYKESNLTQCTYSIKQTMVVLKFETFNSQKQRLFTKWRKTLNLVYKYSFNRLRNTIQRTIKERKQQYKLRIMDKLQYVSSSRPDVWKTVKDLLGTASPSNALKTGNDVCYDNVSKANLFNNHFASISNAPDEVLFKPLPPFNYITNLRIPPLTIEPFAVYRVLAGLNSRKSKRFDNLQNQLLCHVPCRQLHHLVSFLTSFLQPTGIQGRGKLRRSYLCTNPVRHMTYLTIYLLLYFLQFPKFSKK